ncbi:MAG: hypothetical protein ACOC8S_00575 [Bacteroidota bacterium]
MIKKGKDTIQSIKNTDFLRNRRYEAFVFLLVFGVFFGYLGYVMGIANLLNTVMNTAWDLLMNTVFFIMGITVLTGALGRLMIEFGVVRLLEIVLAPLMRPLFNLPGVASLAGLMTFFSDNPAIISLSNDKNYSNYFKKYELVSLTNFGTAFGMGLVVLTFMARFEYFGPAVVGFVGAVFGAVVSTRLMQYMIRGKIASSPEENFENTEASISFKSEGGVFQRFLNALLDGGKSGVDLGLQIIPGVLIISTVIMIVTFGPEDPSAGYQGLAYEGVPILPKIGEWLNWLFYGLFGFKNPELIAFPITSLGAVGAALSLVKAFIEQGIITGNEIAVFTAMGMCWSGYLSTHTAMLDTLNFRSLTSNALVAHTIGGVAAGAFAHYLYVFLSIWFTI